MRAVLPVIAKEKEAYQFWIALHRDFPKTERHGLGKKIDRLLIEVLGSSFSASWLPPEKKMILLGQIINHLDLVKFFTQVAWENKLIAKDKYIDFSGKLEEVGRMLGGWRNGLQKKTPADH